MPPESFAAVRGVGEKPPVPPGTDEVVVVAVVGVVAWVVVVVPSGGGAGGCGATHAVTTARPVPTNAAEAERRQCAERGVRDMSSFRSAEPEDSVIADRALAAVTGVPEQRRDAEHLLDALEGRVMVVGHGRDA